MLRKGGNNIRIKNKVIFLIFTLGIVVSVICAFAGVIRKNNLKFTPRLTAPEYNNSFYYSDNVFFKSGFGIPNCTAYAWGRVYELLKEKPELSTGNARDWYGYNRENNIYGYGKKPKLGAVACFDNEYGGHVAVVEEIRDNKITFSNSAYNGKSFYLTYADINDSNPGQKGWVFQGYIYPGVFEPQTQTLTSVRKVIAADGLNFRGKASLNGSVLDVIPDNSYVYITELINRECIIWCKAFYNGRMGYLAYDYTVYV